MGVEMWEGVVMGGSQRPFEVPSNGSLTADGISILLNDVFSVLT
jgi:hypothetical protein